MATKAPVAAEILYIDPMNEPNRTDMTYILRKNNSPRTDMYFDSEEQLNEWVEENLSWVDINVSGNEYLGIDSEGREWWI